MKKFSISVQLLILVFSILLLASTIFMIVVYAALYKSAEEQVYTRLEYTVPNPEGFRDMPVYFIEYQEKTIDNSKNKTNIKDEDYQNLNISQEELDELIKKVESQALKDNKKDYRERYTSSSGGTIYYFYRYLDKEEGYSFRFANGKFVNDYVRNIFLEVFVSFLCTLLLAVAIIYVWSTNITKRLKNIQNHIIDLPKNKYEKAYFDNSLDEIGELSRSVENMRIEIGNYEKTKQEMLQNLSHDFKTPIAVIKSYAEAYQDGMAGEEALNIIIEQSELLKKKVNRLLQYNSLEYLTKDKPFEDINMSELIKQCVQNYKFQTNLNFELDLDENVCFQGYLENWTTVVDNIIDNAKRYAKSVIKIVLRENRLRIYNDGDPIEEQFANSVFKPYEKGSKGQFGLGMSIVKKTVDFFGMYMSVKNEEYGGVSFVIEKK